MDCASIQALCGSASLTAVTQKACCPSILANTASKASSWVSVAVPVGSAVGGIAVFSVVVWYFAAPLQSCLVERLSGVAVRLARSVRDRVAARCCPTSVETQTPLEAPFESDFPFAEMV